MYQFKIFPVELGPDGKKPIFTDWENKASNDPEVIRQWSMFYGNRIVGWGLPTGSVNGIFAIDIDVKEGKSGFEFLNSIGVTSQPYTAFQHSPSGGMHLFFKLTEGKFHPTTVNRETRVDTRGEGGFVWLYQPDFTPGFAEAPEWVWQHVVTKRKKERDVTNTGNLITMDPGLALQEFNSSIEAILNAGQGERNHTLNTHAYVVGRLVANGALPKEYAYEQLKLAALRIGLPEREAHSTIMSGISNGLANPHTHPFGDGPPEPVFKIPEAGYMPMLVERPRWTPQLGTIQMLMDWTHLKKPQLFENWSTEDIHLTSAIGGVGKTTIMLVEAVCLALGLPFLGFPCLRPGRTMFIAGEDSEKKLYAMIGKICKQLGILDDQLKMQQVVDNIVIKRADDICLVAKDKNRNIIPNPEALEKLFEMIEDLAPRKIIFDPIAMFWGDENDGNSMAIAVSKAAQKILEKSNACVEFINHIGKDSFTKKDVSQFSGRGATALANHSRVVRTLLSLNENEYRDHTGEELPEGKTAIYCYVSKFTDGSPLLNKPFIILRDGYLFERKDIKEQHGTMIADDRKERVYQFIKLHSTEKRQLNVNLVGDYFNTQVPRISKANVRSFVEILKSEGMLEEVPSMDYNVGTWVKSVI